MTSLMTHGTSLTHLLGPPSLKLLEAQVVVLADGARLPLALIHCSRAERKGKAKRITLRLDLDKRVFVDHLEDTALDKAMQELAPKIVEYVAGMDLRPRTGV